MSTTEQKALTADRNPRKLEPNYTAHVLAMTREDMHSKSDIAAELAWRDQQIDALRAQVEALTKPAARWHWLSDHMRVSWSEGKFTSLVRIVSEEWRTSINAAVDRMMAGDWPDADHTPTPSPLTRPASAIAQEARGYVREITTAWDRDNLHDCINRLEEMASRQTQTAALTRPAVPVGSWAWLRGVIGGLAKHQHKMDGTGQTHTFIARDDVMGWIEEGEKRAMLAAAPQPPYKDSTPHLSVGDSSFESWYSTYNPAHKGDKQRARDAYVAGMGMKRLVT